MKLEVIGRIGDVPAERWNGLFGTSNPFTRHEFLAALEASGSVSEETGWQPAHLLGRQEGSERVLALAPAYLKSHSYGEYVFDWAWADAYHRHGLSYYPKLVSAIPFTPVQGQRLVFDPEIRTQTRHEFISECLDWCRSRGISSWHILFPESGFSKPDVFMQRCATQFHWHNPGYRDFQDFLDQLTSRKRKNIRKERERIRSLGIEFQWHGARSWSNADLENLYIFYSATYLKRGQKPYLNRLFFQRLMETMPDNVFWLVARKQGEAVGGALFLTGGDALYGRYWGCLDEYHALHFETCYYQGIEKAIADGLKRFDAGAQGEHKLLRGFQPVTTESLHWIEDHRFRHAIDEFLRQEQVAVQQYQEDANACLPFRQS